MVKKKKREKVKETRRREKKPSRFILPEETKRLIWGVVLFLAALIIVLSFFGLAGEGGKIFMKSSLLLLGKTVFALPLFFLLGGLVLFSLKSKRLYVGYTDNLKRRLKEHNTGNGGAYSKKNAPFVLIFYEAFLSKKDASKQEMFYKSGYGREVLNSKIDASLASVRV